MTTKQLLFEMLTENTGEAMLDSGGAYGRHWQLNAKKTIEDFEKEPEVKIEDDMYTVSVFHYLDKILDLDEVCEKFNTKFKIMKDWESDVFGVSKEALAWLNKRGAIFGQSENTYNGEETLSQTIQYTQLNIGDRKYLLVQIHGGCDVRGGYTDAKLFYFPDDAGWGTEFGFIQGSPNVYGMAGKKQVSNTYDGITITYEDTDKPAKKVDSLFLG